jgi:hypothetical protein
MPAALTADELIAKAAVLTGLTPTELKDFISCTPAQQLVIVQGYADMDWTKQPDVLGAVITIFTALAGIVGVVGNVATAANALKTLVT